MLEKLIPKRFLERATKKSLKKGDILFRQHARAKQFILLEKGQLEFIGHSLGENIRVGQLYSDQMPVGLNAFVDPFRYEFDAVVVSRSASFLVWEKSQLTELIDLSPKEAIDFFQFVNRQAINVIEESSEFFMTVTGAGEEIRPDKFNTVSDQTPVEQSEDDAVLFLLQSPFFESFEEKHLRYLASGLKRRQFPAGTHVYEQGGPCDGIDILEFGEIQFSRFNQIEGRKQTVWFRSISTPGYLLGVSGVLNQVSNSTSTVTKDATVYHLPFKLIEKLERQDITFAMALQLRVTWFLANQFRIVQTRLLSTEFDEETILVTNLIANNQSKIELNSPLHKVPFLLLDKITSNEAFDLLHEVELKGPDNERNLASLCLDNLKQTQREVKFFHALMKIYQDVTELPEDVTPEEVQVVCNRASREAFAVPSIELSGYEHLPEKPGAIFIYNHLLNDPFYSLPNQFQITLDAHYLSFLLFEKYRQLAMRIVRVGRESEYAHENYYERLGFINVYTAESEENFVSGQSKKNNRKKLKEQLELLLEKKINLIVSPEGTSYPTEQSPGKFKSGVFRMALQMKNEPLFVPVVMANFDKRVPQAAFKCRIEKPFRISEVIKGESELNNFLKAYKRQYKRWVNDLVKE